MKVSGILLGIFLGAGIIALLIANLNGGGEAQPLPPTEESGRPNAANLTDPAPGDLGNGMIFSLGQTLSEFKQYHPDQDCSDDGSRVLCGTENPQPSDCPTRQMCQTAYFNFKNGTMDGFSVQYDKDTWAALFRASQNAIGDPTVKEMGPSAAPFGRISVWQVKGGYLAFLKMYGPDVFGREIKRPFTIIFGPDAP
jgi:hypothetical protein